VLFTAKGDWAQRIREFIDPTRFQAVFHNFDDPALALNRFDIIVPLELQDYEALRWRHRQGTNYLMPDEKTIALAHDKIRFNDFLMANGFGRFVPQIYNGEVAYPFVYKKRQGSWGLDADIIHTPQEKEAFEAQTGTSVYFKQEYVGGRIEYVTHAFAVKGRPRYFLTYEHGFDNDYFIKGKKAHYITHREIKTPFLDVFSAILKKLDYTGTACFNFKIVNGVPKFFEMNPRYGATLTLEVNAYLDIYMNALESMAVT